MVYQRAASPLTITATVANKNAGSTISIDALVSILNKNITRSQTFSVIPNSPQQTITFTYLPVSGEIPEISIKVTDTALNQTSIQKLTRIQICNCNSVDKSATCLSTVQQSYNPDVEFLACQCSTPYTGSFCTDLKNYCLALPCATGQSCHTLAPSLQTTANRYVCCNAGTSFNSVSGACDTSEDIIINLKAHR